MQSGSVYIPPSYLRKMASVMGGLTRANKASGYVWIYQNITDEGEVL